MSVAGRQRPLSTCTAPYMLYRVLYYRTWEVNVLVSAAYTRACSPPHLRHCPPTPAVTHRYLLPGPGDRPDTYYCDQTHTVGICIGRCTVCTVTTLYSSDMGEIQANGNRIGEDVLWDGC